MYACGDRSLEKAHAHSKCESGSLCVTFLPPGIQTTARKTTSGSIHPREAGRHTLLRRTCWELDNCKFPSRANACKANIPLMIMATVRVYTLLLCAALRTVQKHTQRHSVCVTNLYTNVPM